MLRHLDQAPYVEVGPERVAPFSYLVALVRLLAVQRVPVLVREDSDRGVAELVDGPESPHRDLAPIGDQHFAHRVERILPGREGREAGGAEAGGAEAGGAEAGAGYPPTSARDPFLGDISASWRGSPNWAQVLSKPNLKRAQKH